MIYPKIHLQFDTLNDESSSVIVSIDNGQAIDSRCFVDKKTVFCEQLISWLRDILGCAFTHVNFILTGMNESLEGVYLLLYGLGAKVSFSSEIKYCS